MDAAVPSQNPIGRWSRFLWKPVAAVASGVLLALAFPPFESMQAAWFALVPLLLAVLCSVVPVVPATGDEPKGSAVAKGSDSLREAFRLGFLTGAIFWLVSLSWLLRLLETSPAPAALILVAWLLLALYCALYLGGFALTLAWVVRKVGVGSLWRTIPLALLIPVLWVGFEYARSVVFGGFPWNALGVSQYANLMLIQCAQWVGVPGVSGVVALLNAGITFTILRHLPGRRWPTYRPHVELFVGLMVVAFCFRFGFTLIRAYTPGPGTFMVTAVQPAIPQVKKWTEQEVDHVHATLRSMTEAAVSYGRKPGLVVWPETATPMCVTSEGESQDLVRDLCRRGVPLLVGSVDEVATNNETQYRNTSFLFDATGNVVTRYDKQHLVPFGEYIPLSGLFPWLATLAPMGWNCSPGREATVFHVGTPPTPFSAMICFEDTMAGICRAFVRRGARLLVNQTNDAWFDRSAGPAQHLSQCVFRSVENRVPMVRVANSGITCLIQPTGAIVAPTENGWGQTPVAVLQSWMVAIPPAEMPLTCYTRHGDRVFAIPCAAVAALCGMFALAAVRRKTTAAGQR